MSRDEKINALSQYHQSLSPSHVSPFSLSLSVSISSAVLLTKAVTIVGVFLVC